MRTYTGFYRAHKDINGPLYNSDAIYTPKVTILRDLGPECRILPHEDWYDVDVITCSAPNLNIRMVKDDVLLEAQTERISRICEIAQSQGADNLILGAFGCGAFKNNPNVVAMASVEAVKRYDGCFKEIVFAIPKGRDSMNYDVFEHVLSRDLPELNNDE